MTVVLDSWAIMRVLEATEPAATAVYDLLHDEKPVMSWINLGEVAYVVQREIDQPTAQATIRDLLDAVDARLPKRDLIMVAASIKATYRMSYADSFAAATALTLDAELWTGDPELLVAGTPWAWRDLRSDTLDTWAPVP